MIMKFCLLIVCSYIGVNFDVIVCEVGFSYLDCNCFQELFCLSRFSVIMD